MSDSPREWKHYDIVLFDRKAAYGALERNWFGYVTNPEIVYDQISVRWWDDQTGRWTGSQNVPASSCLFIGRIDG